MSEPVLRVRGLRATLPPDIALVRGVDFDVARGETVALVGESGSGKSLTALAIMRLLPPPVRQSAGTIVFEGTDLATLGPSALQAIRGKRMAMVLQDPMTALDPVFTIGSQIVETLRLHEGPSARAARRRAIELLELVRLPQSAQLVDEYPHRLSGGQRQRVVIAMAVACSPALLIADEPTTALDVTVQAQILRLLQTLQRDLGLALVLITHNFGIVAEVADRVLVMYAGRIVEAAPAALLFARPLHPYTRGLLAATPRPRGLAAPGRLVEIPGVVPRMSDLPSGCTFAPRCPDVIAACTVRDPPADDAGDARTVACIRALENAAP